MTCTREGWASRRAMYSDSFWYISCLMRFDSSFFCAICCERVSIMPESSCIRADRCAASPCRLSVSPFSSPMRAVICSMARTSSFASLICLSFWSAMDAASSKLLARVACVSKFQIETRLKPT
eukprot:TRINITY_DN50592_c0_g1_i1.p1 TRINITY_DN50592_c0_g1~~TRINITY_DN50592_c0_g1_i1.p1  ORF type:complete len:123 (+),score=8.64 TRINITY_DN50592_c0_g1_i1:80-448(+)